MIPAGTSNPNGAMSFTAMILAVIRQVTNTAARATNQDETFTGITFLFLWQDAICSMAVSDLPLHLVRRSPYADRTRSQICPQSLSDGRRTGTQAEVHQSVLCLCQCLYELL